MQAHRELGGISIGRTFLKIKKLFYLLIPLVLKISCVVSKTNKAFAKSEKIFTKHNTKHFHNS